MKFLVLSVLVLAWLNLVLAERKHPVFIQHVSSGDVTFPNDECIQCRGDQLDVCLSARIECQEENKPAVEMIWTGSSRCQGAPNRVSRAISSTFITCPGPDHFSPMNIDMDRFVLKLQKDFPKSFPNNETAKTAISEYRRMLIIDQLYPEINIVPSPLVDKVWHTHILDTVQYHRDCLRMFGRYLHHAPSFGGMDEKKELLVQHASMLEKYQEHFGEFPPVNVWPIGKAKGKQMNDDDDDDKHAIPDCCKAFCVKPDCSYKNTKTGDCVGCDPLHCGYDDDVSWTDRPEGSPIVARAKMSLAPSGFGGYVPFEELNHPFSFAVTPYNKDGIKLTFSWNISNGMINARHTLSGLKAWYGLGFGRGDDTMNDGGMGYADYIITMYNHNYTGVYDMYRYNKGNAYPCWDVLYECSQGNKTKGTHDIVGATITRSGSTTTSTFSRKLNTGDPKDYVIGTKTAYVMFGIGHDDWFTEHKHKMTCKINLHSGSGKCGDDAWELKAMRRRLGCPSGDCPPRD